MKLAYLRHEYIASILNWILLDLHIYIIFYQYIFSSKTLIFFSVLCWIQSTIFVHGWQEHYFASVKDSYGLLNYSVIAITIYNFTRQIQTGKLHFKFIKLFKGE